MKKLILIILSLSIFPTVAFASMTNGTIQNSYAWGENAGWVNFAPTGGNISVTDSGLSGYAWDSNYGWINLSPTGAGVTNDSEGNLSGYAWSSGGGYINFSGVVINSSGKFTGIATGTTYGRLTFDCDQCNVTTDWRPANVRPVATHFIPGGRSGVTSELSNVISSIISYFSPTPTSAVGAPTSDVGAISTSTLATSKIKFQSQPISSNKESVFVTVGKLVAGIAFIVVIIWALVRFAF